MYYIHTSGTSNLSDRLFTNCYLESRTFSDKDTYIYAYLLQRKEIEVYPQRTTYLVVIETGKQEAVPTTIIMSPTIYGLGSGKFNRLTIQYPLQMKAALDEGYAGYVGERKGVWDFVHVLDLAHLYELVLLDWVEGRKCIPVGATSIMFSGTGTFMWKEVAEELPKRDWIWGS